MDLEQRAYVIVTGECVLCSRVFQYDPMGVPNYLGEPICQFCVTVANQRRKDVGADPIDYPASAYP